MSTARKYLPHYSVTDYATWEGDWELWDGVPVAMTPSPFGRHQAAAMRLALQIANQLSNCNCGCEVLHDIDWVVAEDMVVRPDLVIVCDGVPERHLATPPALIAEVLSPATEHKDRTAKYELYQLQKVKFYLLVDPKRQTIEAFTLDSNHKYQLHPLSTKIEIELKPNCLIQIDPAPLFT